jgi:hyperosmotically inducible protein
MPPPAPDRRRWDVPQAKSLAETPDVVLNSRVRARLISKLASGATDIWPETSKGVVTLTGTVPNAKLRAQAEQVARNERGVRTVRNKLAVKASAS